MNTEKIPLGSIIEITDLQGDKGCYLLSRCSAESFVLIELETGIRWSEAKEAKYSDQELLELLTEGCDYWTVLEDKKATVIGRNDYVVSKKPTVIDKSTDNKEQTMNLPIYKLHVTETNTAIIEVQASTLQEAKQKAYESWEDGMVAFYDGDVNFEHIPTQYYNIGTKIFLPHNGDTLMLTQVAARKLKLINTYNGNRWNDEHITNSVQATHEEIEWMVNPPSSARDRYEWYAI